MAKGRRRGQESLSPSLIVVCEGRTEEKIIQDLRARWRIPRAAVCTEATGCQTVQVVERAKALRRMKSRRGQSIETWVAFDHDGRDDWLQAIRDADDAGIRLAISNPCFEQWAILLHEDQRRHLHHHAAQRQLRDIHPGYHHDDHPYLDVGLVVAGLDDARRRAGVINRGATSLDEPYRNPTTRFSDLLDRLRELV